VPVTRYDAAPLGTVTRTPQGFLRAPARVTRTGVLTYRRADGTVVRELRRPAQVFAAESLATLADAPVTDLHPRSMVTPDNARALALGHVSGGARADGQKYVEAQLLITDAKLIAAVEKKDRAEVSCGYTCTLVEGGGTYEGERYDAEQTAIVYNHVGLGPRGWGRAGAEVALRLDSAEPDDFRLEGDAAVVLADSTQPNKGPRTMDLVTIRLDGIEAQVTPTASQLITRTLEARTLEATTASAKVLELQKRLDALQGELDQTKTQLTAAADPKRFDTALQERLDLLTRVRDVLPDDANLAGKTPRDIQLMALKELRVDTVFDGRSDEYVQAYFDRELEAGAKRKHPRRSADDRNDRNDRTSREPRSLDDQRQRRLDDARLDQSTDVEGILAGKYSALIPQAKPEPEPWRSPLAANRAER
jgi:hypothetical protein